MSEFLIYLLKLNFAIAVFCAFYYLILRKETFYTCNRIYALVVLFISFGLPLPDVSLFFPSNPVHLLPTSLPLSDIRLGGVARGFSLEDGIIGFILLGVVLFAIRFIIQLISLWRFGKQTEKSVINGIHVHLFSAPDNPFSFFRRIFINPANYNDSELTVVLEHEQVHVRQWHTIDIILYEVFTIFCWYNPLVWLMKQYVKQNIEFIVDRQVLNAGYNKYDYQRNLLKANQSTGISLIAGLNINSLSNRIAMMNKKTSSPVRLVEYVLLIPICLCILFCMNIKAEGIQGKSMLRDAMAIQSENAFTIQFDKSVHDFGTIQASNGKTSTLFTFINLGNKPLVINQVKASCGCTVPEWTNEPVLPGGVGYVKATYNPTSRGIFDRTLTVYSNGNPSQLRLHIKGTVND